jgi:ABC-2 type transport system ATP-binding protein
MSGEDTIEHVVELHGLSRRYGRQLAVNEVSLTMPKGQVLGLIGPNGAGKSTLIKMMMGLLPVTSGTGRILHCDLRVDRERIKSFAGYVPEEQTFHRYFRVGEIIQLCANLYDRWNPDRCEELRKLFGLDPRKRIKHLSKGMLTKLALLIAESHQPELLLLDEPMSGLDPLIREEILDVLAADIAETKRTMLFSSHSLGDVRRIADSIALLHEGRLLAHMNTDEMLTRTKRIRAVLADGSQPSARPDNLIWERIEGREWLLTVRDFTQETVQQLRGAHTLEHADVIDLGFEDIFKDYVRGKRSEAAGATA